MENQNGIWIGGKHSVEAAILKRKRKIIQVVALQKNKFLDEQNINYEIKSDKFFNKIFSQMNIAHQGVAALVSALPNVSLESLEEDKTIVMLDGITDPMNIGSIIRNCVAFGIQSIIVRDREFNEKSSSMIKAASGAIEEIQICKIPNLSTAIKYLKSKDFWVVCLDGQANQKIQDYKWDKKNLIVFGSEGEGVGNLIKKNCDLSLKIEISRAIESLNVSNAVAVALYSIQERKLTK
jgi:23S rRNA (guanosine2251-2'-O)-methyltransferase